MTPALGVIMLVGVAATLSFLVDDARLQASPYTLGYASIALGVIWAGLVHRAQPKATFVVGSYALLVLTADTMLASAVTGPARRMTEPIGVVYATGIALSVLAAAVYARHHMRVTSWMGLIDGMVVAALDDRICRDWRDGPRDECMWGRGPM